MTETVVIVGAGQAAAQTASSLRREGFEGRIIVIGDELVLPYQRPPLSKTYLAGELARERLFIKPEAFYRKADIELRLGETVRQIDTAKQCLFLNTNETLDYDHLVLATGGRVRQLTCAGADHPGLHYLRTLSDVEAMQDKFIPGSRLVVIGGGYVGLETAAVAIKHGLSVTLLVARPTVLSRVTSPEVGSFFEQVHRQAGVSVCCNTEVTAIEGDDNVAVVKTRSLKTGGSFGVHADLIIAGVGLLPNVELAQSAGIACDDGINVDRYGRTSAANIYAAGDCANHPSPIYRRRLRLESVQNAIDQGKTVAATICDKHKPYDQVPWFWSDQYDLKLQTAGVNCGYDQAVVRGDPESRSFAVFYLREGCLIAADTINRPAEFVVARKMIEQRMSIPVERLMDERVPVKALASQPEKDVTPVPLPPELASAR